MYFQCPCKINELELVLCSHIFAVMKHNHLHQISESFISKRWTKDTKPEIDLGVFSSRESNDMVEEIAMFALLTITSNRVRVLACKNSNRYHDIMQKLSMMCKEMESTNVGENHKNKEEDE